MKLPSKLKRWAMQLQEYLLNIEHKKFKIHLDVDCLSKWSVKEKVYSLPEKKNQYC